MKILFGALLTVLIFLSIPLSYAESYMLTVDEHRFDLQYTISSGNVIAMDVDRELTSLLIATENITEDSLFSIDIPLEVLSADNNGFAILVNGVEVNYDISQTDSNTSFSFLIYSGTEEIEIIGTKVIPEFPVVMIILLITVSFVILFTKSKNLSFR